MADLHATCAQAGSEFELRQELRAQGIEAIEKAIETCLPNEQELQFVKSKGLEWSDTDKEYASREMARSVKHIAQAADLLSREHLLLSLDSMPRLAGTKGTPKMEYILNDLVELGYCAARYPDMDPMFVTDAPFDKVLQVVRQYHN